MLAGMRGQGMGMWNNLGGQGMGMLSSLQAQGMGVMNNFQGLYFMKNRSQIW